MGLLNTLLLKIKKKKKKGNVDLKISDTLHTLKVPQPKCSAGMKGQFVATHVFI